LLFLIIHFNIILPSVLRSLQWSLSMKYQHQNPVSTSPIEMRFAPTNTSIQWFISEKRPDARWRSCETVVTFILFKRKFKYLGRFCRNSPGSDVLWLLHVRRRTDRVTLTGLPQECESA
jgi:hypothetical protein